MDLNGGRRPNVFISNPKNPTMNDLTKCLNSCVNDWQGPASYDKWNALYMDPSGGVSSPYSKALCLSLKGIHELKATRESFGRAKSLPMKCFVFV